MDFHPRLKSFIFIKQEYRLQNYTNFDHISPIYVTHFIFFCIKVPGIT